MRSRRVGDSGYGREKGTTCHPTAGEVQSTLTIPESGRIEVADLGFLLVLADKAEFDL